MGDVTCGLALPNQEHLADHIVANAPLAREMVTQTGTGKTVTICGAGPSLADHHDLIDGDEVWACNSGLPYLVDRGLKVTHGFTVDQGEEMLGAKEWARTFDISYLLGSSISPALAKHVVDSGRPTLWFHNYLGLKDPPGWAMPEEYAGAAIQSHEFYLYSSLYPPAPQVGYGLNSVPRAVCLALWMGFEHIRVIGADHAAKPNATPMPPWGSPEWVPWLESLQLYASGRSALEAFGENITLVQSEIETKYGDPATLTRWVTRPDMVISAQHMANLAKSNPRVELVGNTLPNALLDKPVEWLAQLPTLTMDQGVKGFDLLVYTGLEVPA